jgi:short subunit dehydrogenase-like uncharacterized protein
MIALFGATGYTGRLVARALVRAGAKPLLAGRSPDRLGALAAELGGLDVAVADARDGSLRELLTADDVLVTTVGPFLQVGDTALRAAIEAGATYLDSTGEPPFVRRVFTDQSAVAQAAGARLLTAFGYDYVPGNLAGALALDEAGPTATRVDVGYFVTGRAAASTGTIASGAGLLLEPGFAWRGGRLVTARNAASVRAFTVQRRAREGVSIAGSEHLTLPRLAPGLRDVNVYLGWFGPASRLVQAGALAGSLASRLPVAGRLTGSLAANLARRTGSGPDTAARARSGSAVVAAAYSADGRLLTEVHLTGPNPYDLTANLLAWGATRADEHGVHGLGALGPVDAFGLEELRRGCERAGLVRIG